MCAQQTAGPIPLSSPGLQGGGSRLVLLLRTASSRSRALATSVSLLRVAEREPRRMIAPRTHETTWGREADATGCHFT